MPDASVIAALEAAVAAGPANSALRVHLASLLVMLFLGALAGAVVPWMVAFAVALPFGARRTWRWWRRRHPAASSWRPPA